MGVYHGVLEHDIDPDVEEWVFVDFETSVEIDRVRLDLTDLLKQEPVNVHLWEMTFVE